jgi:hypothetical protein
MSLPNADKLALSGSQAGMRFIAQMKFYNDANFERLRVFIEDSYMPELLAEHNTTVRLTMLQEQLKTMGRLRVKQVLAAGKHQVGVAVSAELTDELFFIEVQVEEDYPHRIMKFLHAPLRLIEE